MVRTLFRKTLYSFMEIMEAWLSQRNGMELFQLLGTLVVNQLYCLDRLFALSDHLFSGNDNAASHTVHQLTAIKGIVVI